MESKITNETQNDLFNRKEIVGTITSDSVPSYSDVKSLLSEKYSVPEEAIKISGIQGKFGSKDFEIKANIYNSQEERDKVEFKKKREKDWETKKQEEKQKAEEEQKQASEEASSEESQSENQESQEENSSEKEKSE